MPDSSRSVSGPHSFDRRLSEIVRKRGILLDVEGTTTPISFVYGTLFPFVRLHLHDFLQRTGPDLHALKAEQTEDLNAGRNPPDWSEGPEEYVIWLMDQDRKSTGLKELQGLIWKDGYKSGKLKGEVFPDVPVALQRWSAAGVDIRIFSSGSILAQRLLFSSTNAGDLTHFINGHFDTATGPKTEPGSYRRIAEEFHLAPSEIIFVSDAVRELNAARSAGMLTILCIRPGNAAQELNDHRAIRTFDEID
jgi:enolase-phosphatase E1